MSLLLLFRPSSGGGGGPVTVYPYRLPLALDRSLDQVRNIVEVTRVGGPTYRATASAAQLRKQGNRTLSVTAQITSDVAAAGMAAWLRDVNSTALPRVIQLDVDVLADPTNLLPRVLGDELGTRIQLTPTFNSGATWTVVGLLDGIGHKWTRGTWVVSYYLDVVTASAPVPSW